eukprot:4837129-Amphidinium_carterae.2
MFRCLSLCVVLGTGSLACVRHAQTLNTLAQTDLSSQNSNIVRHPASCSAGSLRRTEATEFNLRSMLVEWRTSTD